MTARTGLDLYAISPSAGATLAVRASGIEHPNGFTVQISPSWRTIEASLQPDNFAGALIRKMGAADSIVRARLAQLMEAFAGTGLKLSMRVNGTSVADFRSLPTPLWSSLELKAARLADPEHGDAALEEIAKEVCGACLAPVLVLLELEDDSALQHEAELPEGAKTRIEVNRYERSPANRAACIAIHGARCMVCRFDFEQKYGPLGAGFIEVHHKTMVSQMGGHYLVNPRDDLVPLCSNCHSMVHRVEPPLAIEALKTLLR
jgi:5-methylcytosine-specific restriction protein A